MLDKADAFEIAMLIYRKWAEEFDHLNAEKASKDDGSPEWAEFHAERLKNGVASKAKWKGILGRWLIEHPVEF